MNRPRKAKGPYPPCFYQKHGSFYIVRQNKWKNLGHHLGDALAEYARIMGPARETALGKLVDDVLNGKARSKSTQKQYAHAASILKRKLREFEPHEVKGKHIAALVESLAKTPNMANRVLSFGRQVFDYALTRQMIDANPCIKIPRLVEHKRKRLLSSEEWWAIHEKAGPRLKVIMELQFLTGQRIGDVLSIRRSQLTEAGIDFVQQKTGKPLTISWSDDLKAAVKSANALSGVAALTLLRGKNGKAPNYRSVALQFTIAAKAADVADARLNDGRAMSATAAKRQGKNPQALLGHTSEANTNRYLRGLEGPLVEGPTLQLKRIKANGAS